MSQLGFNRYELKDYAPESRDYTVLEYCLRYQAADGRERFTNGAIHDMDEEPESIFQHIMSLQTEFVRSNLRRLEVTTPIKRRYGFTDFGGDMVLSANWVGHTDVTIGVSQQ